MLQQKLTKLRDFILQYNTYFGRGYDNVVKDNSTGQINYGNDIVFPADELGNYFYLRLPNNLQPDYNFPSIADSHLSIGVKYDVILVAIVSGADGSILLENMLTTLGRYQDEPLRMTKAIYQSDVVISQELAKIGTDNIRAALQKFTESETGICSVHFQFTIPFIFQRLNCIQNPCKSC